MFTGELVIKLGAEGRHWRYFFRDGWNRFDLLVVATSYAALVASALGSEVAARTRFYTQARPRERASAFAPRAERSPSR